MKHESHGKRVVGCLIVPMLMAWLAGTAAAQEDAKKAGNEPATQEGVEKPDARPADTPAAGSAESKKPRKKPRGRLPNYYSRVVTEKQRSEIYAIQARYNDQIESLKEQLDELAEKRDQEVEKVLSDEQLAEVTKLVDARRAAKEDKAASGTGSDGS